MKMPWLIKLLPGLAACMFLAGCASYQVNWNARVGTYTMDQAIVDLGPPDKQAKLTDGRMVCEWVSHHYTGGSMVAGSGFCGYPFYGYPGYYYYYGPSYYEAKLRLTFGTNNVLASWSKH